MKLVILACLGFFSICICGDSGQVLGNSLDDSTLFAPPHVYGQPVLIRLQEGAIEQHKQAITHDLRMNACARYGIKGIVGIALIYIVYKMLNPETKNEITITVEDIHALEQTNENWEKVKGMLETLPVELSQVKNQLQQLLGQGGFIGWFKNMFRFVRDQMVAMALVQGVSHLGDNLLQSIFHSGDIAWFVAKRTLLMQTFEELAQYTRALDGERAVSEDSVCMYFIVSACNSLAKQLEAVLGFMEYKQEKLPNPASTEIASIIRYLFNGANNFIGKIDTLLQDHQMKPGERKRQLEDLIAKFRPELNRIMTSFARIEKVEECA